MGASGKDTSFAPGVALVVLDGEDTVARLGTVTGLTAPARSPSRLTRRRLLGRGEVGRRRQHRRRCQHRPEHRPQLEHACRGRPDVSVHGRDQCRVRHEYPGARRRDDQGRREGRQRRQRRQEVLGRAGTGRVTDNPNTSGNSNTSSLPTAKSGTDQGNSTTTPRAETRTAAASVLRPRSVSTGSSLRTRR